MTNQTMPRVHAYAIVGNFDESIKYALAHHTTRSGRFPAAVWLHPDRIPTDWPDAWPPVYANKMLNYNIIGIQAETIPVQIVLLQSDPGGPSKPPAGTG